MRALRVLWTFCAVALAVVLLGTSAQAQEAPTPTPTPVTSPAVTPDPTPTPTPTPPAVCGTVADPCHVVVDSLPSVEPVPAPAGYSGPTSAQFLEQTGALRYVLVFGLGLVVFLGAASFFVSSWGRS